MRLSCPNCDARYEVPDEVMPRAGRDVQCSNCGQTWFQRHPNQPDAEEEERQLSKAARQPRPAPPPAPETPPRKRPQEQAPTQPHQPTRRQLDPAVADILRAEAEAEQAARRQAAANSLESQPDLGLEETDPEPKPRPDSGESPESRSRRAQEAKRRMARMRGEASPEEEEEAPRPEKGAKASASAAPRRELLPDIDEINSTLRSDRERAKAPAVEGLPEAPDEGRGRSGFRSGFALALLVIALGALAYLYAPQIGQSAPALEPALAAYVGWVDQMRLVLDNQLARFLVWLDGIAADAG